MRDSQSTDAEHRLQQLFSKIAPLAILLPPLVVLLFAWMLQETPSREVVGRRIIQVAIEPVQLDRSRLAPLRLAGAWRLSSPDPNFGGISALSVQPDGLLALTDSGRLIHLPRPDAGNATALIRDLPDGPGSPFLKRERDSEALLRDPAARGWWVSFESPHELWLYDQAFERALGRMAIPDDKLGLNRGIEAIGEAGGELLLFAESGAGLLRVGKGARWLPIDGPLASVSDAAAMPDGGILLIERRLTPSGFANALVRVEPSGRGFAVAARMPLPLGRLDNAEALAIEPLPGGAVRLWLMTDDNFQKPLRTLLLALDIGPWDGKAVSKPERSQ